MKKVIALTLILIISSSIFVFANDISTIRENLTKYNIITNFEIPTINRAEAAKIIVTMLGMGDCKKTETSFIDVPMEYWASGYIQTAKQIGIINGHGDGTFKPEEKLTNEQFVKMLVCTLGYEPAVIGGYPVGYFTKATSLGITKNLDLTGTDVAKRCDVAVMIYNALDIPIMYQDGYGDFVSFVIADGKNGVEKKTLRIQLDKKISPLFNGDEYSGRVLKISNLKYKNGIYTFNNSLNTNDKATYIINKDTYIQTTSNTVELYHIKDGMYAQGWHHTDDTDEIELLKVELMKNKPSGI